MTRPSRFDQGGFQAQYADLCLVCKGDISPGDFIFKRRGHAVHVGCQSGANDE